MLNVNFSSYWLEIMSMPSQTSVRGVACFAVKQVFAFAPEISWGIKNMYTPVHVGHVQQHFQPSRHLHLKLELQTRKSERKKQKLSLFQLTKKQPSLSHTTKNFHFDFFTSLKTFTFTSSPRHRCFPLSLVARLHDHRCPRPFRGGGCWWQSLTTFITKLLIGRWLSDSDKDYMRTWLNVWFHDSRCLPSSW